MNCESRPGSSPNTQAGNVLSRRCSAAIFKGLNMTVTSQQPGCFGLRQSSHYLPARRNHSQPAPHPASKPRMIRISTPPMPLSVANLELPGIPTAK